MAKKFTITLPRKDELQVREASIAYGISPEELSRIVISRATQNLLDIPEESLDEYKEPEKILGAYKNAVRDTKKGSLFPSRWSV
ncbi:MAG TPA: hypothetical protein VGA53_01205 [Candidatus Paceibacterota bacterium]